MEHWQQVDTGSSEEYPESPLRKCRAMMNWSALVFAIGAMILFSDLKAHKRTSYNTPAPICTAGNQVVDCNSMQLQDPAWQEPAKEQPSFSAAYLGGFIIIIALGMVVVYGCIQNNVKQELIDFAYEKARIENTNPDMSFLFYFDTRHPRAAELEIAERAYLEMMIWRSMSKRAAS